jgi:hypothetical protein
VLALQVMETKAFDRDFDDELDHELDADADFDEVVEVADPVLDELVDRGDLDELIREIERRCSARDWMGLVRLRRACRAALQTGRQLWPAASLAEYRLALEADAPFAAATISESAGYMAVGPLSEVVAVRHTFDDMAPYLDPGPQRGLVAHERGLRGDDVDDSEDDGVLEIPVVSQEWEPQYTVATYHHDRIDAPKPELPSRVTNWIELEPGAEQIGDPEVIDALRAAVEPWLTQSNGRFQAVCVEGDHLDAIAALGVPTARTRRLTVADAFDHIAWAAASGGALGRRRGLATGRWHAWWVGAALAGFDLPVHPDELGAALTTIDWWWWETNEPEMGWQLQLAITDSVDGLSWAVSARDAT